MNRISIIKKLALGLSTLAASFMLVSGVAHAITTIPYNGDQTVASPVPAFNVFTGVPAPVGNEPDFLRARVPVNGDPQDPTTQYSDPLNTSCTDGQVIELRVYVHNGASADANNNGTGPSIAHNSIVKVSIPGDEATSFMPQATISASNAETVSDGVTINCGGQQVKLNYVNGSASQFSLGSGVSALPDSIVSSGALIHSEKVPGDVWGCWNERVYVVLEVKVQVIPPKPIPAACTLLSITQPADHKVTVNSVTFTANDATVSGIAIDFGDGTNQTVQPNQFPISHTYTGDTSRTITATILTNLGNETSAACMKPVSFTSTPTPPVVPPSVTSLVNTGPGNVIGIFAATSLVGAFLHRKWTLRRKQQA